MQALLCCLYLAGGIAYLDHTPAPGPYHWRYWRYDVTQVNDPYGVAELGYAKEWGRKLLLELAARHESSIPVNDFGQNSLEFRVRFYPWR